MDHYFLDRRYLLCGMPSLSEQHWLSCPRPALRTNPECRTILHMLIWVKAFLPSETSLEDWLQLKQCFLLTSHELQVSGKSVVSCTEIIYNWLLNHDIRALCQIFEFNWFIHTLIRCCYNKQGLISTVCPRSSEVELMWPKIVLLCKRIIFNIKYRNSFKMV